MPWQIAARIQTCRTLLHTRITGTPRAEMNRKHLYIAACLAALEGLAAFTPAKAAGLGTIVGCYNGNSCGFVGILDGPAFQFNNTSGQAITNAAFNILTPVSDTFEIGVIPAGGSFVLVPGVTNDGGSGHNFFTATGSVLDTSDLGPAGDGTQFSFTGMTGALTVSSGIFTPAPTSGPSNDANAPHTNFLGLDDGPCNDCFGPKEIAQISLAPMPVPGTLPLMGSALAAFGLLKRKKVAPRTC